MYYIGSYTFKYLTHNKMLLIVDLKAKFFDFPIIKSQTFIADSISIIAIYLKDNTIRLENLVYISNYNANIISLG